MCSAGSGVFLDRVHLQWSVPWDVWLILLSGAIDLKRAAYQPPDKNLLEKSMRVELLGSSVAYRVGTYWQSLLIAKIVLRQAIYQQYVGTNIVLYGGVAVRWATLKIRKSR